jgi:hypothetical protein
VLIVAHRNSLRGILKIIDGISTADIQKVRRLLHGLGERVGRRHVCVQ